MVEKVDSYEEEDKCEKLVEQYLDSIRSNDSLLGEI